MAITATVTPGTQITDGNLSQDILNLIAQPTVQITGTVGTSELEAASITAAKLNTDAFFYASSAAYNPGTSTITITANTQTPTTGMVIAFRAEASILGATNIVLYSGGAGTSKVLKKRCDADVAIGDIVLGEMVEIRYDGTNWQLMTMEAVPETCYSAAVTNDSNDYTIALPAPATFAAATLAGLTGKLIGWKVNATNSGIARATIKFGSTSLAAQNICWPIATTLQANDLKVGEIVWMVYDGTNFQLVSHRPKRFRITGLTVNACSEVITQAHGLGAVPRKLEAYLECTTAEHGYAQYDVVKVGPNFGIVISLPTIYIYKTHLVADATNIYFIVYEGILVPNRSTYADAIITAGHWTLTLIGEL